jgi:hypothetical protein
MPLTPQSRVYEDKLAQNRKKNKTKDDFAFNRNVKGKSLANKKRMETSRAMMRTSEVKNTRAEEGPPSIGRPSMPASNISGEDPLAVFGAYGAKMIGDAVRSPLFKYTNNPITVKASDYLFPKYNEDPRTVGLAEQKRRASGLLENFPMVGDIASIAASGATLKEDPSLKNLGLFGLNTGLSLLNPIGGAGQVKNVTKGIVEDLGVQATKKEAAQATAPYDLEAALKQIDEEVGPIPDAPTTNTEKYLLEEPARVAAFDTVMSHKQGASTIGSLEDLAKYYDVSADPSKLSPVRLTNLSKRAYEEVIQSGKDPLQALLDGTLTMQDFTKKTDSYTVVYKPRSEPRYNMQQRNTAASGVDRFKDILNQPMITRQPVVGEGGRQEMYSEALGAGFHPHEIQVINPRGKVTSASPHQEHSVSKSKAATKLNTVFTLNKVDPVAQTEIAQELSNIINARDTFFDLPPKYNMLKGNKTTEEFKNLLLYGGKNVVIGSGKAAYTRKEVKPDRAGYERFFGETEASRTLEQRKEVLAGRLYDWQRKYEQDIPSDFVDELIDFL